MATVTFKVPSDYTIPEQDEAKIRTVLNLVPLPDEAPEPIPDAVIGFYYSMKRCLDVLGAPFSDYQIATVICLASVSYTAGPIELIPAEAPLTFREVVARHKIPEGSLVAVMWCGEWQPGYFCGFSRDEVIVQVAGTERFVSMGDVREADDCEFPGVRLNLNDLD